MRVVQPSLCLYYQADAWCRMLARVAVPSWAEVGILRANSPTLVVLCDAAGLLAGSALVIWGAQSAGGPASYLPSVATWRRFEVRAEQARALRRAESSGGEGYGMLTPSHLWLRLREPGLEPIAETLTRLRAELGAIFLASTIHSEGGATLRLRFAGARPTTCILRPASEPSQHQESAWQLATSGWKAWLALAYLAEWAYGGVGDVGGERLLVARDCLARELPVGREVALEAVAEAAEGALGAARANLAILRRGQTEQYFRSRQAALDVIAAYAEGVREAGSALASDVVENVYRTVGLLVAVAIAALLQPASSLFVVRLASLLYVAYVGFVLAYYLRSREDRHTLNHVSFERRVAVMRELSASERVRLAAPAREADDYFARYLARSRAIYWGLIVAGLLLTLALFSPLSGGPPLAGTGGARSSPTPAGIVTPTRR